MQKKCVWNFIQIGPVDCNLEHKILFEPSPFHFKGQNDTPLIQRFMLDVMTWCNAPKFIMAQIICSTRRLVEDFVLDVQQKFSTRRLVAEKQLPTRRLLEGVNIYQTTAHGKD